MLCAKWIGLVLFLCLIAYPPSLSNAKAIIVEENKTTIEPIAEMYIGIQPFPQSISPTKMLLLD